MKGDKQMKLDHDFVRTLLLTVEKCPNPGGLGNDELKAVMLSNKKSFNELAYTIQILIEGDIVSSKITWGNNKPVYIYPVNLTFKGHEYLDNIRDNKIWRQTKSATSKLASVSIDIMSKVASELIAKSLGIN